MSPLNYPSIYHKQINNHIVTIFYFIHTHTHSHIIICLYLFVLFKLFQKSLDVYSNKNTNKIHKYINSTPHNCIRFSIVCKTNSDKILEETFGAKSNCLFLCQTGLAILLFSDCLSENRECTKIITR